MGSLQFGLENQIDSRKKDHYIFYYNVYDRKYDERGTIDTYESEVLGLKYDLSRMINEKISFMQVLNTNMTGDILIIMDHTKHQLKVILII